MILLVLFVFVSVAVSAPAGTCLKEAISYPLEPTNWNDKLGSADAVSFDRRYTSYYSEWDTNPTPSGGKALAINPGVNCNTRDDISYTTTKNGFFSNIPSAYACNDAMLNAAYCWTWSNITLECSYYASTFLISGGVRTRRCPVTTIPTPGTVTGPTTGSIFPCSKYDRLYLPDSSTTFGLTAWSIGIWFKLSQAPASLDLTSTKGPGHFFGGTLIAIPSHIDNTSYAIRADVVGTGSLFLMLNTTAGIRDVTITLPASLLDYNWHQLVITKDTSTVATYLDGLSIDSQSSVNLRAPSNKPAFIGYSTYDDTIEEAGNFRGSVDDVRIWKEALTEVQVSQQYHIVLTNYSNSFDDNAFKCFPPTSEPGSLCSSARLNSCSGTGGWSPSFLEPPPFKAWLQVDMGTPHTVTGISTRGNDLGWVTTFNLHGSYFQDTYTFVPVWTNNKCCTPRLFLANSDESTVIRNDFPESAFEAQYVRVILNQYGKIGLAVELYVCDPATIPSLPFPEIRWDDGTPVDFEIIQGDQFSDTRSCVRSPFFATSPVWYTDLCSSILNSAACKFSTSACLDTTAYDSITEYPNLGVKAIWQKFDGGCYAAFTAAGTDSGFNRTDWANVCHQFGGFLASVHSPTEDSRIRGLFESFSSGTRPVEYWLGLNVPDITRASAAHCVELTNGAIGNTQTISCLQGQVIVSVGYAEQGLFYSTCAQNNPVANPGCTASVKDNVAAQCLGQSQCTIQFNTSIVIPSGCTAPQPWTPSLVAVVTCAPASVSAPSCPSVALPLTYPTPSSPPSSTATGNPTIDVSPAVAVINVPLQLSPIPITDANIASPTVTVTLTVEHGSLDVSSVVDPLVSVSGRNTNTITITGPTDSVESRLASVTYLGTVLGSYRLTGKITDYAFTGNDSDTIIVKAANTPPTVNGDSPISTLEATRVQLTGLSVNDDSPSVVVTVSVTQGELSAGSSTGKQLQFTGSISQIASWLGGGVYYTPDAQFYGNTKATLSANDNEFTVSTDITIVVTGVNDPPVWTIPNTVSTNEGAPAVLNCGISDPDSNSLVLTMSVAATSGSLNIPQDYRSGCTVQGSVQSGNYVLVVSGGLASLQQAISVLTYTPAPLFNGLVTINLSALDENPNFGPSHTVSATANVNVLPVNDPPSITVPPAQTMYEDSPGHSFGPFTVQDPDSPSLSVKLSVVGEGTISVGTGDGNVVIQDNNSASVLISGPIASINNLLTSITYSPPPLYDGLVSIVAVVSDTYALPYYNRTATVAVTIIHVNHAPVLSLPLTATTNEDTLVTLNVGVGDVDGGVMHLTLSVPSEHGTISLPGYSVSASSVSVSDELSVMLQKLGTGLVYTPAKDFNGAVQLSGLLTDDGQLTDSKATLVTVVAVNDAPVVGTPVVSLSVKEDTTVSLSGFSASDIDSTSVAVTLELSGTGTLTFNGQPVTSPATFQTNIANITSTIAAYSYAPAPNVNDQTVTVAVTLNDLGLTATGSFSIYIIPQNDQPALQGTFSYESIENADSLLLSLRVEDIDSTLAMKVTLSVTPAANLSATIGSSTQTSGLLDIQGTLEAVNAALATLTFKAAEGAFGQFTITATVSDPTEDHGYGPAQQISRTIGIDVKRLPRAPVISAGGPFTTVEDPNSAVSIAGLNVADEDSPYLTVTLTFTGSILQGGQPTLGQWSGFIQDLNNIFQTLTYIPAEDFFGTATITATATDETSLSSSTTITVNVTPRPPHFSSTAASSTPEDVPLPFPISVADADGEVSLTVSLAQGQGSLTWQTANGLESGVDLTFIGEASALNSLLGSLVFTPTAFWNGAASISVDIIDGQHKESSEYPITVVPVNNAPELSVPGATGLEDTTINVLGLTLTDVDSTFMSVTVSIPAGKLTLGPAVGGTTIFGDLTSNVRVSGPLVDVQAVLSSFTVLPTQDYFGDIALTVTADDNQNGEPILSVSKVSTVHVTPVNDPPSVTATGSFSGIEDSSGVAITGISVSDVDSSDLQVVLSLPPGVGSVSLSAFPTVSSSVSGSVLTLQGPTADLNTALGTMAFVPSKDWAGETTLTVQAIDDYSATSPTKSVAISITPVNDPPTLVVPAALSTLEDVPRSINGFVVSDVDSPSLTLVLSLPTGTGSFSFASTSGLIVSQTGNTYTLNGSPNAINTALGNVQFVPSLNFNGDVTVSAQLSDGEYQVSGTVVVTVIAVDDPPTISANSLEFLKATPIVHVPVLVADVDSPSLTVTVTVPKEVALVMSPNAVHSGNGTTSITWEGDTQTVADALASQLYILPLPLAYGTSSISVQAFDGTNTVTYQIPVDIIYRNVPPRLTVAPSIVAKEDDAAIPIPINVQDIDDQQLTITITIPTLQPTAGTLVCNTMPGGAVVQGSQTGELIVSGAKNAVIDALGTVVFVPSANWNGMFHVTVSAYDGTNTQTATSEVQVEAVNDPPVLDTRTVSTEEDTPVLLTGITLVDIDSTQLQVSISGYADSGTLQVSDNTLVSITHHPTSVELTGPLTALQQVLATGITYIPNTGFNGEITLAIDVTDSDLSAGPPTQRVTGSLQLQVSAVNNPPLLSITNPPPLPEDSAATLIAGIAVSDPDSSVIRVSLDPGTTGVVTCWPEPTSSVTVLPVNGVVQIEGPIEEVNKLLSTGVYFTPPANFFGDATIGIKVFDGLDIPHTGGPTHTLSNVLTVKVTAVNDAPVVTVPLEPVTTLEDSTGVPLTGLSLTDIDSGAISVVLAVPYGTLVLTNPTPGVVVESSVDKQSITLTGPPNDIGTLLSQATYIPPPGVHGTVHVSVSARDSYFSPLQVVNATFVVEVIHVNTPPMVVVPNTQHLLENADWTKLGNFSAVDKDSEQITFMLSFPAQAGQFRLSLNPDNVVVSTTSTTLSVVGPPYFVQPAVEGGIEFRPSSGFYGEITLMVSASDESEKQNKSVVIVVERVNDAPVVSVPSSFTVSEDALITITPIQIIDSDSQVIRAVITSDVAGSIVHVAGTSSDLVLVKENANTVEVQGPVGDVDAVLRTITVQPPLNYNGNIVVTVSAIDDVEPVQPQVTATETITVTVSPVNDAAEVSLKDSYSTNEDTPLTISGIVVTDVEQSPNLVLTIEVPSDKGTLSLSDTSASVITLSGSPTSIAQDLSTLVFTPAKDVNGLISITAKVFDPESSTTGPPSTTRIAASQINISPVNDEPTIALPSSNTLNEDQPGGLGIDGFVVADVDDSVLSVTISVPQNSGIVRLGTSDPSLTIDSSGSTIQIVGPISNINNVLDSLRFVPAANFNGDVHVTIEVSDGSAAVSNILSLFVNPTNDAPTLTVPQAIQGEEDTPLLIVPVIAVSDVDSAILRLEVSLLDPNVGSLSSATLTGSPEYLNTVALPLLTFSPKLDWNGRTTIKVVVNDDMDLESTGPGPETLSRTFEVIISAVNDPPTVAVPVTVTPSPEDTPLPLGIVSVTDIDSPVITVTITADSGFITTTVSTPGVTVTPTSKGVSIEGSPSDISKALENVAFVPALNFNGDVTVTVSADDSSSGAPPAVVKSTFTVTVTQVNDPPTIGLPSSFTVKEDSLQQPLKNIIVSDVDSSTISVEVQVDIGLVFIPPVSETDFTVEVVGSTVTLRGSIDRVNTALGTLTYSPPALYDGSVVLKVTASDGQDQPVVKVGTITVEPVNHAPEIQVSSLHFSVSEDTRLPLPVKVVDVDNPSVITVKLQVSNDAQLVLPTGSSTSLEVTWVTQGTEVLLKGELTDINAILHQLELETPLNWNGGYSVTITVVDDQGAQPYLTVEQTLNVQVTPVDDPPVISVPSTSTSLENQPKPIPGVSVKDVDNTDVKVKVFVPPEFGNLSVGPGVMPPVSVVTTPGTVVIQGPQDNVNQVLSTLVFTPTSGVNGQFSITVSADGQSVDSNIPVVVTPWNDPPVLTVQDSFSTDEDIPFLLSPVVLTDKDSAKLRVKVSIDNGVISMESSGLTETDTSQQGTIVISGPTANVAAAVASMTYTPNPNFNGQANLVIVVYDDQDLINTGEPVQTIQKAVLISVSPINDQPVILVPSVQPIVVLQNGAVGVPLSVTDVDDPQLIKVVVELVVGMGEVASQANVVVEKPSRESFVVTSSMSVVNNVLSQVTYKPANNFYGEAQLMVTVYDTLDSARSGLPTYVVPSPKILISVTHVNQPPTLQVPTPATVNEDSTVGVPLTGIVVQDPDSSVVVTVTTPANTGVLRSTYDPSSLGVWVNTVGSEVIIQGPVTAVNTYLSGLSYVPSPNYFGDVAIGVSVSDGEFTVKGSVSVTVSAVNDPPTMHFPGVFYTNESTQVILHSVEVLDIDSPTVTVTVIVSQGQLSVATSSDVTVEGAGTGTLVLHGPPSSVNASLVNLVYTPNPDTAGETSISIKVSDGSLSSTTSGTIVVIPTTCRTLPQGTKCDDGDVNTRDDRCVGMECKGLKCWPLPSPERDQASTNMEEFPLDVLPFKVSYLGSRNLENIVGKVFMYEVEVVDASTHCNTVHSKYQSIPVADCITAFGGSLSAWVLGTYVGEKIETTPPTTNVIAMDALTGVQGITWSDALAPGGKKMFSIKVTGEVGEGPINFAVRSPTNFGVGLITGPAMVQCSFDNPPEPPHPVPRHMISVPYGVCHEVPDNTSCSGPPTKIEMCTDNGQTTIAVPVPDVGAHLEAGDTIGACSAQCDGQSRDCPELYQCDWVLLLDESGSISSDNFNKMKRFGLRLLDIVKANLAANSVNVGIALFSNNARQLVELTGDYELLTKRLSDVKQQRGKTYTNKGLEAAASILNAKYKGVPPEQRGCRNIIVITDGQSTNPQLTLATAKQLKSDDLMLITAIGVGNNVDKKEIAAMASSPSSTYVTYVDDWDMLIKHADALESTCYPPPSSAQFDIECATWANCDLFFVVDVSQTVSAGVRRFINSFIMSLPLSSSKTRIGFSGNFGNQALTGDGMSISSALAKADYNKVDLSQSLERPDGWASSCRQVIIVTDANSLSSASAKIEALKGTGIKLSLLSIGSQLDGSVSLPDVAALGTLSSAVNDQCQSLTSPDEPSTSCAGLCKCNTVVVWPSGKTLEDTQSTMRFAGQISTGLSSCLHGNSAKIGFIEYGKEAVQVTGLTSNLNVLQSALTGRTSTYQGNANALAGLDAAVKLQLSDKSSKCKRVFMVQTSSDTSSEFLALAKKARKYGIVLTLIGVGDNADFAQLKKAASSPAKKHAVSVDDYSDLEAFGDNLRLSCSKPTLDCKALSKCDVLFLWDESSSVQPNQHMKIKRFTRSIVDSLKPVLNPVGARVGVIAYGSTAVHVQALSSDYNEIVNAIDAQTPLGGVTRSDLALDLAKTALSAAKLGENECQRVVVVTDGGSMDMDLTMTAAAKVKADGASISVVAVGDDITSDEIANLASYPKEANALRVETWAKLENFGAAEATREKCTDIGKTPQPPTCIDFQNCDIALVLDEGAESIKPFVQTILDSLRTQMDSNKVRVSLTTFSSSAKVRQELTSSYAAVLGAISEVSWQKDGKNFAGALRQAGKELLGSSASCKRVLALLTGESGNVGASIRQASRLRRKGVAITVLGVDQNNEDELNGVASAPVINNALSFAAWNDVVTWSQAFGSKCSPDMPAPDCGDIARCKTVVAWDARGDCKKRSFVEKYANAAKSYMSSYGAQLGVVTYGPNGLQDLVEVTSDYSRFTNDLATLPCDPSDDESDAICAYSEDVLSAGVELLAGSDHECKRILWIVSGQQSFTLDTQSATNNGIKVHMIVIGSATPIEDDANGPPEHDASDGKTKSVDSAESREETKSNKDNSDSAGTNTDTKSKDNSDSAGTNTDTKSKDNSDSAGTNTNKGTWKHTTQANSNTKDSGNSNSGNGKSSDATKSGNSNSDSSGTTTSTTKSSGNSDSSDTTTSTTKSSGNSDSSDAGVKTKHGDADDKTTIVSSSVSQNQGSSDLKPSNNRAKVAPEMVVLPSWSSLDSFVASMTTKCSSQQRTTPSAKFHSLSVQLTSSVWSWNWEAFSPPRKTSIVMCKNPGLKTQATISIDAGQLGEYLAAGAYLGTCGGHYSPTCGFPVCTPTTVPVCSTTPMVITMLGTKADFNADTFVKYLAQKLGVPASSIRIVGEITEFVVPQNVKLNILQDSTAIKVTVVVDGKLSATGLEHQLHSLQTAVNTDSNVRNDLRIVGSIDSPVSGVEAINARGSSTGSNSGSTDKSTPDSKPQNLTIALIAGVAVAAVAVAAGLYVLAQRRRGASCTDPNPFHPVTGEKTDDVEFGRGVLNPRRGSIKDVAMQALGSFKGFKQLQTEHDVDSSETHPNAVGDSAPAAEDSHQPLPPTTVAPTPTPLRETQGAEEPQNPLNPRRLH